MAILGRTRIHPTQGTTLLWTEHYSLTHPAGRGDALRHTAFALALTLLAAGAAVFLTLEGPVTRESAVHALLRAL
jgi:hypothetical protein